MRDAAGWKRGDVVAITDPAHLAAVCILTTAASVNEPNTWALVDDTCYQWRSTAWVEGREPRLLVRDGSPALTTNGAS